MNKSGCFFKALPETGLVQKEKQGKGGRKAKQRFTIIRTNCNLEKPGYSMFRGVER